MNDKQLTERITTDLLTLPGQIGEIEADLAEMRAELNRARTALENMEQETIINVVIDGKNETQRKQQMQAALAANASVDEARNRVIELEIVIAGKEVQVKGLAKQWQSAMGLAELQAARINLMARYQPQPKKAS